MKYFLIIVSLFTLFSACSNTTKSKTPITDEVKAATSEWIDKMKATLPDAFCQPEQFFRQCFKITEDECIQNSVTATKTCIDKFKDDIKIEDKQDGGHWGQKVGACAGETYEITLTAAEKKIDSEKCNNVQNWIK